MVCGNPYYINQLPSVASDIAIGNSGVQFSASIRNLGLLLHDRLCWKEHVNEVCKRANTLMYRLYRLRDSTTLVLRKHLIQARLWLLVAYCSLALCNISADQDKRLQVVLNTGIHYIFGARRDEHITPYRRQLSWITNVDRRLYFAATLFYKLNQSGQPAYLANQRPLAPSSRPPQPPPLFRYSVRKMRFYALCKFFKSLLRLLYQKILFDTCVRVDSRTSIKFVARAKRNILLTAVNFFNYISTIIFRNYRFRI